jgi:hypothetical protein
MNPSAPSPPRRQQPTVDAGRLWAGGAATAVVAALIALVGVLIVEGLFDVEMVHPPLLPIGDSFWLQYACTAALLAIVATALAHLLATTTPRPRAFFGWVVGLATVVGVVLPFTEDGTLAGQVSTALVNLVIGVSILSLLSSVVSRTLVWPPGPAGPPGQY